MKFLNELFVAVLLDRPHPTKFPPTSIFLNLLFTVRKWLPEVLASLFKLSPLNNIQLKT